jgi:putative flippase GtrA
LRLLKFAVVGTINTLFSLALVNLAVWLGARVTYAWVGAWVLAFSGSYLLNRSWTYADRKGLPVGETLPKFAASNMVALGASTTAVWLAERGLANAAFASGFSEQLRANGAAAAGVLVSMTVNYSLATFWAFRETHPGD